MHYNEPRGAAWLAEAFHFYSELASKAYNKLFPKVDPRKAEAHRLRRAADRIRIHHPSVAKDLYAAADRHERND